MIVAAGSGRRFGGELPKQYQDLSGRPMLAWTLEAFQRCKVIDHIVLVVAPAERDRATALVERFGIDKVRRIEDGGQRRSNSVRRGLSVLPEDCTTVAIHDGARPLVAPESIERVVAAAERSGAAILAVPARDTVKRAQGQSVAATEDRSQLHLAQTPQVFRLRLIQRAYDAAPDQESITDDAQLVEQLGEPVTLVPGDPTNLKVTEPGDMDHAAALLDAGSGSEPRVGTGIDAHRLVEGRPLILGGVTIPHPRGLLGHSDADVLAHAICDALLGAAGLGDLGRHFPPSDPELRGISSLVLLTRVAALVREAGHQIGNIDATIVCQQPHLAPHVQTMRENLGGALGIAAARVSVKATTTEGLGFTGEEEGIAAQAVTLLHKNS